MQEVAPDIHWIGFSISNVYLVGKKEGPWVVVDTCVTGHFDAIHDAAAAIYGKDARPEAIVLTHAHADHFGSAAALAAYWDVPIYAHPLDLPYLTARADLPPSDPTVGGVFGFACRFMRFGGTDLGETVHPLPEDGSVPGLPEWRWYPTPGHTPGHISLFREEDQILIAGDAVLTVDTDYLGDIVSRKQTLSLPPKPATYDWIAVRRSAQLLAGLRPVAIAAGHGVPMAGDDLPEKLQAFADDYIGPFQGRYVAEPATFDENGVVSVPPAPPDPLPKIAAVTAGVAMAALIGLYAVRKTKKGREETL